MKIPKILRRYKMQSKYEMYGKYKVHGKQKMHGRYGIHMVLLAAVLFLTACGFPKESTTDDKQSTGFVSASPGVYDSADTAVITEVNTSERTITLKNMEVHKKYTLTYDGTTCFYDKYGKALSASQLRPGELVDLTFMKLQKRLNTMQKSTSGFVYQDVTGYQLDSLNYQAYINTDVFSYSEETVVVSGGEEVDLMDINPIDVLTFCGKGSEIYGIIVEKGHGYVRLKNEEYFIGGFIEIGSSVVQKVSENMLLVVPEGEHQALISKNGTSGTKEVLVRRNVETELDVGNLKGSAPKYGTVLFTISPEDALLYIDGERTDYSVPVRMEYGIHQMIVMADRYKTIKQYLKVGQESAGIEVDMEIDPDISGNDLEDDESLTISGNDESNAQTSTLSYYVTVDAPLGVEVYVDGNYIGITPCSFKKQPGSHTITLRKTGYLSKSYTVQIDEEEKNTNYAFLDLTKE